MTVDRCEDGLAIIFRIELVYWLTTLLLGPTGDAYERLEAIPLRKSTSLSPSCIARLEDMQCLRTFTETNNSQASSYRYTDTKDVS